MAIVKRNNARTTLAGPATPFAGVKFVKEQAFSGLKFTIQIGLVHVEMTQVERDQLVDNWSRLEKEWETK